MAWQAHVSRQWFSIFVHCCSMLISTKIQMKCLLRPASYICTAYSGLGPGLAIFPSWISTYKHGSAEESGWLSRSDNSRITRIKNWTMLMLCVTGNLRISAFQKYIACTPPPNRAHYLGLQHSGHRLLSFAIFTASAGSQSLEKSSLLQIGLEWCRNIHHESNSNTEK